LTNEELKRLNEDNDRLDEFLEKHSQIKDINAAIEEAMDWVEKTAGKRMLFCYCIAEVYDECVHHFLLKSALD